MPRRSTDSCVLPSAVVVLPIEEFDIGPSVDLNSRGSVFANVVLTQVILVVVAGSKDASISNPAIVFLEDDNVTFLRVTNVSHAFNVQTTGPVIFVAHRSYFDCSVDFRRISVHVAVPEIVSVAQLYSCVRSKLEGTEISTPVLPP